MEEESQKQVDQFSILIRAVLLLCALASGTTLAIIAFHKDVVAGENMQLIHVILGVIVPAITGLLAMALSQLKKAVADVHEATNSRLTQLLELTANSSRAEGLLQGRSENAPPEKKVAS